MKSTRARSIVIYILTAVFVAGLGLFLWRLFTQGEQWATNPINEHITGSDNLTAVGTITDRNQVILAQSVNGKRIYNEDYTTRCALLHTIGDNSIFISTAVQNMYRSDLAGYNPLTGISLSDVTGKGNDIKLTLDSSLCSTALKQLGDRTGAVCVYNYKTGEILCMVSTPTYDPQNPPDIDENNKKWDGVYLNRVFSSSLTPGSIFKIVTSAAAIENIPDISSRTFTCNGSMVVDGDKITCLEKHGQIGFKDAMSESCNVAFAQIALELGADKMTAEAEKMGFGTSYSIDGIPTVKSSYNVSAAGKGELAWSGIGQADDLVNPMHMTILMGAIANGGVPVMPYLISNISYPLGVKSHQGSAKEGDRMLNASTANSLKEMLRYDVTDNYGDSLFPGLTVCAKTGTAEVSGKKPNGWMVGFSTNEDCPLAFAVVVENSGYGISTAGPVAEAVLKQAAQSMRK